MSGDDRGQLRAGDLAVLAGTNAAGLASLERVIERDGHLWLDRPTSPASPLRVKAQRLQLRVDEVPASTDITVTRLPGERYDVDAAYIDADFSQTFESSSAAVAWLFRYAR